MHRDVARQGDATGQTANNHNLTNESTTGFALISPRSRVALTGSGYASRVYATYATTGGDSTGGTQVATGRDLDIAV